MVYFTSASTTPIEFFFGRYEAPPEHLGTWLDAGIDAATGERREERWLLPDGKEKAGYLLQQVRYRDATTGEIVRIDAERRVRRKRVSTRP